MQNDTDQPNPSDFHINKMQLDVELERQPELYWQYAKRLADARSNLEHVNNVLKVTEAELDASIRNNPAEYELGEKPTVDAMRACIVRQREYRDDQREVQRAQYQVGILAAAVAALDHKKSALGKLVDLQLSNYFSTVRPTSTTPAMSAADKARTRRRNVRDDDE